MDYANLPLAQVRTGLDDVARQAQAAFGDLDARQLNWRPDATQWSVAQCLDHLLNANRLMLRQAEAALSGTVPRTLWQRLPWLPRILGRSLIRSQSPGAARKFKAPADARPAASAIPADVVPRFVEQHRQAMTRLDTLDERTLGQTVMVSPFAKVITYSVLDAWRLILAHDRRHVEQAQRVTAAPGFPAN